MLNRESIMSMRVTFSTNYTSTIYYYKRVSKASGKSLSSIISEELNRAALSHSKKQIPMIKDNSHKKKTDSEFYQKAWKTHILLPKDILDAMSVKNNVIENKMSNFEKDTIKEKFSDLIDSSETQNAIYIYINRNVSYARRLSAGIGTILLLRKTMHEDVFFDIKKAVLIPIIELISYRMDSILEKHSINFSFPHICWIPIYYINDQAVMIPVIRKCDISFATKSEGEIIIINPFDDVIRNKTN